MPIEFNCESCSKLLRVPDGSGGKQCQCPGCSVLLNIPFPKVEEPVPSAPASDAPDSSASASDDDYRADVALCIPCPKCKHELICDPSLVGTKGQCRSCKHIFVISDLPSNDPAPSDQSINWVFSCPKCNQLFEGSEAMRGRRGKCHACGDVFFIELRVAGEDPIEEPFSQPSALEGNIKRAPTNSFDSSNDELTLDVVPDDQKVTSEPPSKSKRQATSPGTVVSKASPSDKPIQFNCTSCSGRMEVPGAAVGQLTHCPHCKRQLTIPFESEPTPEAKAANDPWSNLSPVGSAPVQTQQSNPFGDTRYPPPMPMSAPMSGSRRRSGNDSSMYVSCGVIIAICALLGFVIEILYIMLGTVRLMRQNENHMEATFQIGCASLMFILSLLQLVGGISFARRKGIYMARTAAIICCLPCFPCLNIPFGIWGCMLIFNKDSERHFR